MEELVKKIEDKMCEIFKYDEKYKRVITRENLQVTYRYLEDEESLEDEEKTETEPKTETGLKTELIRMVWKNEKISVGATRYEVVTIADRDGEKIAEPRMMYEGWDGLLSK